MLHVKTGDTVLVLTGKDKNKTGKVISASPKDNTVIVEGVNIITKHRKPRSQEDKGGIEKIAGKINASNVQVICPACKKATRVAHKVDENGEKHRTCKKCGASLDGKFVKKTNKDKAEENSAKATAKATKTTKTTKTTTKKSETKVTEKTTKSTTAKKVVKSRTTDKAGA